MLIKKKNLNGIQLIKNKANLFTKANQWGPFYSYYFIAYYKNKSILNLSIIFFFCKKTNLLISKLAKKKSIIMTAFFDMFLYNKSKNKNLKNFYKVLYNKVFNFISNFYELVFKQQKQNSYIDYKAYRKPSLIFFMKNTKAEQAKIINFQYVINRLRIVMIQSLLAHQIYNGVGYCIYINHCYDLYLFYFYTYKLISQKQWTNIV